MRAITEQQKQEAIAAFAYEGTLIADTVYGSGHINDTFRLTFAVGNMGDLDVILQRMNADAFPHPEQLMENIAGVTGFLKKKIIARGGDPERETLNIIPQYHVACPVITIAKFHVIVEMKPVCRAVTIILHPLFSQKCKNRTSGR